MIKSFGRGCYEEIMGKSLETLENRNVFNMSMSSGKRTITTEVRKNYYIFCTENRQEEV